MKVRRPRIVLYLRPGSSVEDRAEAFNQVYGVAGDGESVAYVGPHSEQVNSRSDRLWRVEPKWTARGWSRT